MEWGNYTLRLCFLSSQVLISHGPWETVRAQVIRKVLLSTLGWPWLGGQRLQARLESIQSGGDQRWPRETKRRAVRT